MHHVERSQSTEAGSSFLHAHSQTKLKLKRDGCGYNACLRRFCHSGCGPMVMQWWQQVGGWLDGLGLWMFVLQLLTSELLDP